MRNNSNFAVPASKKGWLPVAVGLLILGGVAACTVPGESTSKPAVTTAPPAVADPAVEPAADPAAPAADPAPAPAPTPVPAMESKGFVLESLNVGKDFGDSFKGTARISDTQGGRSAVFTVTFFAGNTVVGTMTAMVSDTPAGQAQTVDFISSDENVAYDRYEFQTDSDF